MNRYERRKRAIDEQIRSKIDEYKSVYKKADDEDREPTTDERLEIEASLKAIETLKDEKESVEQNIKTLADVEETAKSLGPALGATSVVSEPEDRLFERMNKSMFTEAQKSLGEQFVSSKGYQEVKSLIDGGGSLPQGFSTGKMEMKGTLLEGAGSPGSGSGGGALPVPQVVPGTILTLFQKLTIADLLDSGVADGNQIRYINEGTATSGAGGVAEGAAKPESTLGLGTLQEPIKKIATFLPVSDEMLEDASFVQSYINQRLLVFVRNEEERQLYRGASGGNEVQGILTSRSVPVYAGGTAVGNKAVQTFKALNSMRGSAFIEPEWIVMHPTDWEAIRLLTDTAGQFYGGGPFGGSYGGAVGQVSPSSQVSGAQDVMWNKPVYVTAAIGGAGTALIGTRENAAVWRKGGITVEASNSHSNFFQTNMVAIRAEERLGLAVYRAGGYVELRLS